jgi:hypothetical protein
MYRISLKSLQEQNFPHLIVINDYNLIVISHSLQLQC